MNFHKLPIWALLCFVLTAMGTQTVPASPIHKQLLSSQPTPEAPVGTSRGVAPSQYIQLDISAYPADQLKQYATQAYQAGHFQKAIQYQYWAIQNGDDGFYDLACDYALAGQVDQAIHWLYIDAQKGSVDVAWTDQDPDLNAVRGNDQWPELRRYLVTMEKYWHNSGNRAYTAIVPDDYTLNSPIPLIVGLHGKGDTPFNFIDDGYQELANALDIAIVSISGPVPLGINSYAWTTDPRRNDQHLNDFLSEILEKEQINPSSKALLGFSQGAQVSLQTVVYHPEAWNGVVAMSPGLYPVGGLSLDGSSPDMSDINVILTNGEEEGQYNLDLSNNDVAALKARHVQVRHKVYPDQGHQFPADYYQKLASWLQVVLTPGT